MELYIAEKPLFGNSLASVLGVTKRNDGYIECGNKTVTWAFGHLYAYKEPDAYIPNNAERTTSGSKRWNMDVLPIIPEIWQVQPVPRARKQISVIERLLKKASLVVNAADAGREGEEIFQRIIDEAGYNGEIKRLWCSATDKDSLTKALRNLKPGELYNGYSDAARARAQADWLIGMNMSRAYTLANTKTRHTISVGRVQTPTLNLVVQRDREIENFKSVKHFLMSATTSHSNGSFNMNLKYDTSANGMNAEGLMLDKSEAEAIKKSLEHSIQTITSLEKNDKSSPPPLPLSQTKITELASNQFGYSAISILNGCQSLYEKHKATSYPRTDCSYLPESHHNEAELVLHAISITNPDFKQLVQKANHTIKSRAFNDKRITEHHAIVPTAKACDIDNFSSIERNLYKLISTYYIAQFYPRYEYAETTVRVNTKVGTLHCNAIVNGNTGWKNLFTGDKENSNSVTVPIMKQGDSLTVDKVNIKKTATKPPKHYTEGTLTVAMSSIHKHVPESDLTKYLKEEDGIGTVATRAPLIEELKKKKYITKSGKKIVSSNIGREIVDTVPDILKSPLLTAYFERQLKEIQNKVSSVEQFLDQQTKMVRGQVEKIKSNYQPTKSNNTKKYDYECPKCGYGVSCRHNRAKNIDFWACVGPKCRSTYSDINGMPEFLKSEVS